MKSSKNSIEGLKGQKIATDNVSGGKFHMRKGEDQVDVEMTASIEEDMSINLKPGKRGGKYAPKQQIGKIGLSDSV